MSLLDRAISFIPSRYRTQMKVNFFLYGKSRVVVVKTKLQEWAPGISRKQSFLKPTLERLICRLCLSWDQVTPKWRGEAKSHRRQCEVNALRKHTNVKNWIFSRVQADVKHMGENGHVDYGSVRASLSGKVRKLDFVERRCVIIFLGNAEWIVYEFIHTPIWLKAELALIRTRVCASISRQNGALKFTMNGRKNMGFVLLSKIVHWSV